MQLVQSSDSKITLQRGDGRELIWDVSVYDRTRYTTVDDIFKEINGYWSSLNPEIQESIWQCYEEIYYELNQIHDTTVLGERLTYSVAKLYQFHDLEHVGHWVRFRERIRLPEGLKDVCGPEDDERTIQRTYLKKDYVELVVMAVALRIMIPVWGEFIRIVRSEVGPNFKEYAAMRLLSKSNLIVSAPMERLRMYVQSSIDMDADTTSSVMAGLGTSERPEWLLSMVVVRRIAPGDISVQDERGSIITNIYAFVTGTLRDLDRKFGGGMKDKFEHTGGDKKDDDRTSMIELFKVKQPISYGAVAAYSVYTENPVLMAKHLDETIPEEMVLQCLEYTADLYQMVIKKHHLVLCQWVVNPVIVSRAIDTLNKASLLRVMAVTQALLWWWDFPELAILTTAVPRVDEGANVFAMETRMRIPPDLQRQLAELYPYTENVGRAKGMSKGSNVAVRSIQALSKELTAGSWSVHCPPDLAKRSPLVNNAMELYTPVNIMEMLAKLVLRCV